MSVNSNGLLFRFQDEVRVVTKESDQCCERDGDIADLLPWEVLEELFG